MTSLVRVTKAGRWAVGVASLVAALHWACTSSPAAVPASESGKRSGEKSPQVLWRFETGG